MLSHNSKYYKKSLKRNKVLSHTDGDNTQTLSQKKIAVTQPANSQLEEITQQANAENDNLLDAQSEKTNSTAPSVSLTQLLEQTMECFLVRLYLPTWLMLRKIAG